MISKSRLGDNIARDVPTGKTPYSKGSRVNLFKDSDLPPEDDQKVGNDGEDSVDEDDLPGRGRPAARPVRSSPKRDVEQTLDLKYASKTKEADILVTDPMPRVDQFPKWWQHLTETVSSCSAYPEEAFRWICSVKEARYMEQLETSTPFHTLDAKLGVALTKIAGNGPIGRRLEIQKEISFKHGHQLLKGRQIAWIIWQHFVVAEPDGQQIEIGELLSIKLRNNDLRSFIDDWETLLTRMTDVPDEYFLEALLKAQLETYGPLRETLALYRNEYLQSGRSKSYRRLMSMVKVYLQDQLREKNKKEMAHGRQRSASASATKGKSEKDKPNKSSSTKSSKDVCRTFEKNGSCNKGDKCPYKHDAKSFSDKKSKGRSSSPKKDRPKNKGQKDSQVRGRSPSGKTDVPICRFYKKGSCKDGDKCDFFHPPPCRNLPDCKYLSLIHI